MQATTQIQSSGTAQPPQRANQPPNLDAGQFSAALTREIEQRQEMAPAAPAPQPKAATPAKQPEADQPADKASAPAQEAAAPHAPKQDAKKADKRADAGDAGKDGADSAEHPATAQVTDMLALVASLKPLQNAAAAKATGEHAAAAAAAGGVTGKAGADAGHLAALQAATRALGKDGAEQPAVKGAALPGQDNQATDAAGAAATDARANARDAADLRAVADATQLKGHADAMPAREALAEAAAMKDPAPAAPLVAQAQPVTLEVAQAVAGAAGDRIAARVGTPAWESQMGQKIVWMVAGEEQSASLTLNPPDLGPLQVVLSVTNDQASVSFSSNQQEVRQALENALPRLREMMSDSGIALGNASVSAGMPDQRQAQGGEQPRASGFASRFDNGQAAAEPAARPAPRVTTFGGRSGVDTFA